MNAMMVMNAMIAIPVTMGHYTTDDYHTIA